MMAPEFEVGSDGSDGVQDEEVLEVVEGVEGEEVEEVQAQERASLAERKRRMKEKKKQKPKARMKDARAPPKRSGYRIPKRPWDQVHREVIVAHVLRDAEVTRMRAQWDSLTAGKPKALPAGRRVRFRL